MVGLAALVGGSAAACGSSGGSKGGSDSAADSTGQSSSVGAPSSSSGGATQVTAQAAKLMKRPTSIPFLGPKITSAIPSGKTIDSIDCGQSACQEFDDTLQQAATAVGWKVKVLKTDGTPQQVANAWQQAIREKPFAVVDQGAPMSEVGNFVKQAVAAGSVVIASGIPDKGGTDGLLATVQDGDALGKAGAYMATWVAAGNQASDGKGGAVFVNLPDFPVLQSVKQDFQSGMAKDCKGCSVATLDIGLSGLQGAPDQVVSYLRAHSSVKYVAISALNAFDAVAPAVRSAGLKVKIIGAIPDATALSQLRAGKLDAAIAASNDEQVYQCVNLLVRKAAGLDSQIPQLEKAYFLLPWLLTKANVPSGDRFPIVENYAELYKAVWGK